MRYKVLYNPISGHKNGLQIIEQASFMSADCDLINVLELTDYASFFAGLDPTDVVILCGGDGTLNRFANDTAGIPITNEVLFYGMGNGNDFLRDIGCAPFAEAVPIKDYIACLPTVEVAGQKLRFINNVGFGIDGYCCEVADQMTRDGIDDINYSNIAVSGVLGKYKATDATVIVDGKSYRFKSVWIAPTMNGRYYGGGMMPTPAQDRTHPETLSVLIYHCRSRLGALISFPKLFKGTHVDDPKATILTGREIEVIFDAPRAVQVDGETFSGVTSYRAIGYSD